MANTATVFLLSQGTVVSISTDDTTFTPVNQLQTISFSGSSMDMLDVTNLGSPGAYKEVSPGVLDSGKASVTGVFDPADAGQLALTAAFNARQLIYCKMQLPALAPQTTGLVRTFAGYVSERPTFSVETNKTMTFTASLTITGAINDTPGS